jgi:hypothetical protein
MIDRRHLLKLLAVGALGPAGIAGLIQATLANAATPVPTGIRSARGKVLVNGKAAAPGTAVRAGDTVTTGRGAEAIYVIGQDAFLQRDESKVSFGADASAQLMRVVTGKILSVFGKGERKITVSTATIGIRGTACYIEDSPARTGRRQTANARARTYFCLCYGSVELTPTAAPEQRTTYATEYHDHPLMIYDDPGMASLMTAAPVENHTDIELTMLEALVDRLPPFHGRSDLKY